MIEHEDEDIESGRENENKKEEIEIYEEMKREKAFEKRNMRKEKN